MSISGHKTRSIFDRYNIVAEEQKREALARAQSYLAAVQEREAVQALPTPTLSLPAAAQNQ